MILKKIPVFPDFYYIFRIFVIVDLAPFGMKHDIVPGKFHIFSIKSLKFI